MTDMRGVDLSVFEFDYDLTWAAFLMNADHKVYGRFGGRDGANAEAWLSLSGLKFAMKSALAAHQKSPAVKVSPPAVEIKHVEQYPAAAKLGEKQCIHCHQVYDFRRDWLMQKGKWTQDELWVYPPPANLGLSVSRDQGNLVEKVLVGSPAHAAGLKAGDVLDQVNGYAVASYADLQYALHKSPAVDKIDARWRRADQLMSGAVLLKAGWRKSDISWRGSMWGVPPKALVYGRDLTTAEKAKLGLPAKQLAFAQGSYVPPPAYDAGIRPGDVIIGADGHKLEMSMAQFNVWVRVSYQVGERIAYDVLRGGERMKISMTL